MRRFFVLSFSFFLLLFVVYYYLLLKFLNMSMNLNRNSLFFVCCLINNFYIFDGTWNKSLLWHTTTAFSHLHTKYMYNFYLLKYRMLEHYLLYLFFDIMKLADRIIVLRILFCVCSFKMHQLTKEYVNSELNFFYEFIVSYMRKWWKIWWPK